MAVRVTRLLLESVMTAVSCSEFRTGLLEINRLWQSPIGTIDKCYRNENFYERNKELQYQKGEGRFFVLVEASSLHPKRTSLSETGDCSARASDGHVFFDQ
jgi:hypothetical protein